MQKKERDEELEKRMHLFDGWVKEGKSPGSVQKVLQKRDDHGMGLIGQ